VYVAVCVVAVCVAVCVAVHVAWLTRSGPYRELIGWYGVATISRLLEIIGLFRRI